MFCMHCGRQLQPQANFCPACGTAIARGGAPAQPERRVPAAEHAAGGAAAGGREHPAEAVPAAASAAGRPTVLVVDDDRAVLRLLQVFLEHHGLTVLVAGDGVQALGLARRTLPAVILTDLLLPGIDGYTLRAQLLADPRTAQIPVLLLTAVADIRPGQHFAEVIVKPFALEELLERIRRYLP